MKKPQKAFSDSSRLLAESHYENVAAMKRSREAVQKMIEACFG